WTPLAERYSTDSERQFIEPGGQAFRRLRLEGVEGRPRITKVVIEFAGWRGHRVQVVNLHRPLVGYNRVRDIELNGGGEPINRIVVYADPRFGGEYSVFGT